MKKLIKAIKNNWGHLYCYVRNDSKTIKTTEFEIIFRFNIIPRLEFWLDFSRLWNNIFDININLLDLISFKMSLNEKQDHAGFRTELNILGFGFLYSKHDMRHWDYDNDKWEE